MLVRDCDNCGHRDVDAPRSTDYVEFDQCPNCGEVLTATEVDDE